MIRAGVPQSVAMSISDHKTVSMFGRYNITSNTDGIAPSAVEIQRRLG
jgi:hypothetical protein